jgi:hypothetical protein
MYSNTEFEFKKARDFSGMLNATFDFIRLHFRYLLRYLFLYAGIPASVGSFLIAFFQADMAMLGAEQAGSDQEIIGSVMMFIGAILLAAVILLIASAMVVAVATEYVILAAEYMHPPEQQELWNRMRPRLPGYFLTQLAAGLLIMLGFILCVAPGIWLFIVFTILYAVRSIEGAGIIDSMKRSYQLIRGRWWITAGLFTVMLIIAYMLSGIFSLPALILMFTSGILTDQEHLFAMSLPVRSAYILLSMLSNLASVIGSASIYIMAALYYFNLIESQPATGIQRKMESIGKTNVEQNPDDFHEEY